MAQSCLRYITLEVNCGFSRTAIRELTNRNKRSRNNIDARTRALKFQKLFKDCPNYCQNGSYCYSCGYNSSQFDHDCEKVLLHFHKKWHPRLDYEKQFSIENWNASFTTSFVKHEKEPIHMKLTPNERKKKLHSVYRQCRDKENEAR